jgi:hypothetical protein
VLVSVQDMCTVYAKRTIGSEIILDTQPMVHVIDEAQLEARFGPFRDSANLDARSVHGLCQSFQRLRSHFERTR